MHVARQHDRADLEKALALQRKAAHLHARALAVHERPDLFARGRGALTWEKNVPEALRRSRTSEGDEQALKDY
eukprot:3132417-Karenia_brevis.AAC.1